MRLISLLMVVKECLHLQSIELRQALGKSLKKKNSCKKMRAYSGIKPTCQNLIRQ